MAPEPDTIQGQESADKDIEEKTTTGSDISDKLEDKTTSDESDQDLIPDGLHQRRHWSGDSPTHEKIVKGKVEKQVPTADISEDLQLCPLADFVLPSEYLSHPGGQTHLEKARNSEVAGILFLSYHSGCDLMGKVATAARAKGIAMPKRGPMYDEMHEAIRQVRKAHPNLRWWYQAWCVLITVSVCLSIGWWLYQPDLLSCISVSFSFELYVFNVFHTRHHQGGRLYTNDLLHRLTFALYEFVDATWAYLPSAWAVNHHIKHHVFTNDDGVDTDVPAMYPFVRSCDDQPRLWFHKFQTFYFVLLVPFAGIQFPVNNILVHGGKVLHCLAFIGIMFVTPCLLHGIHVLPLPFFVLGFAGMKLAYLFAISHAHDALRSTTTEEEDYKDIDKWVAAQVEDAISYGGWFNTFLFGGINMQIEHHLAPALDPPLYYLIGPEIERISKKYGVNYTKEPTVWHAIWQFHLHLWRMGQCTECRSTTDHSALPALSSRLLSSCLSRRHNAA